MHFLERRALRSVSCGGRRWRPFRSDARARECAHIRFFQHVPTYCPNFHALIRGTREISAYLTRREKVEEVLKRLLLGVERLQFGAHVCLRTIKCGNEREIRATESGR